jgi:hypothetical protein
MSDSLQTPYSFSGREFQHTLLNTCQFGKEILSGLALTQNGSLSANM